MEEKMNIRPHKLTLENRGAGTVTGIREVVSFDENQVVLDTDLGLLASQLDDPGKGRVGLRRYHRQFKLFLQRGVKKVRRIPVYQIIQIKSLKESYERPYCI